MLQSRGITDLLVAEKKAQEIIEEARKRKVRRIKDAQNEAKSEIEQFKNDRDQHYKSSEQQQLGNREKMTVESKQQTDIHIESLKAVYESNKDQLLERIMALVCDIKPESHINARIQ